MKKIIEVIEDYLYIFRYKMLKKIKQNKDK